MPDAKAENERLRGALVDAKRTVQIRGAYADKYFQEKWNSAGDIAAIDAALSVRGGGQQRRDAERPDPKDASAADQPDAPIPLSVAEEQVSNGKLRTFTPNHLKRGPNRLARPERGRENE
ncbi:hypothetical protein [Microvirga makkahensis]|uniref:hypothetical protein n=1 Tax=Microvirga makkahensis TaxID=1128670 RepID=UPI00197C83BA|nr:hypothetical protein [Microvirga makkahensis]